jgi:hypothetical protein
MIYYDLAKYKLLKRLEEEAEKAARYVEFAETIAPDDIAYQQGIDRAVLRYYALLRRIETIEYTKGS